MMEAFQMAGMFADLTERLQREVRYAMPLGAKVFKVEDGEAIWADGGGVGGL